MNTAVKDTRTSLILPLDSLETWITKSYNESYVKPLELDKRLTALISTQGTGKTEMALQALAGCDQVVILTHLRSLAADVQRRFNQQEPITPAAHYQHVNLPSYKGSLAIVVNSLPRVDLENYRGCAVFIDEGSQLLRALYGDHMDSIRGEVLASLQQLLKHASHIVIGDADLSPADLRLFAAWAEVDKTEIEVIRNAFIRQGRRAYFHHDPTDASIRATLLRRVFAGHKAFVGVDSRERAKELAVELQGRGRRVLLITSETDDFTREAVMRDINLAVQGYDILITSPSLFTGVDLSDPYFEDVYLFVTNIGELPSTTYVQALQRVRNPQGEVHVWVRPINWNKPTDPKHISTDVVQRSLMSLGSLDLGMDAVIEVLQKGKVLLEHYSETTAWRNDDINNLQGRLINRLAEAGYELEHLESKQVVLESSVGALIDSAKSPAVKDDLLQQIIKSPTDYITPLEDGRFRMEPSVIRGEHVARVAARYKHLNGNSREDFADIVRHINPEQFAQQVENFEALVIPRDELRRRELEAHKHATPFDFRGQVAKGTLLKALIKALGGTLRRDEPLSHSDVSAVQAVFQEHSNVLRVMFKQATPTDEAGVIKTLNALLNKLGLSLEVSRPRQGGEGRPRQYSLDQHRVGVMEGVAKRRREDQKRAKGEAFIAFDFEHI
jgi:hypothetical protein